VCLPEQEREQNRLCGCEKKRASPISSPSVHNNICLKNTWYLGLVTAEVVCHTDCSGSARL